MGKGRSSPDGAARGKDTAQGAVVKSLCFGAHQMWAQIPTPPATSCVILSKRLYLSELNSSSTPKGGKNPTVTRSKSGFSITYTTKCFLGAVMTHSKCSMSES